MWGVHLDIRWSLGEACLTHEALHEASHPRNKLFLGLSLHCFGHRHFVNVMLSRHFVVKSDNVFVHETLGPEAEEVFRLDPGVCHSEALK